MSAKSLHLRYGLRIEVGVAVVWWFGCNLGFWLGQNFVDCLDGNMTPLEYWFSVAALYWLLFQLVLLALVMGQFYARLIRGE